MCGLVGVAGNLQQSDEVFMKRLFVLDYFRGTDSTGLGAISPTGEHSVVKRATHPLNLFDSKQFDKALDSRKSVAFIGHNRAATLGAVNDENAHPFQYGNIIGAHNGTLDKASWKRLEEASGVETNVDSAAIFACIDAIGIDETIKLMEHGRTSQTGAWALVWYDSSDQTLRMLKNTHRPLFVCVHSKGDRIAWASEWVMLRAAEEMSAGWDSDSDKKGYSFFPLEDDWLYEFKIENLMAGFTIDDFHKAKNRQLKGKEPALAVVTTGGAPFITNTSTTNAITTTSGGAGINSRRVIEIVCNADDPFAGIVSKAEFNRISRAGCCSWCGGNVNYLDDNLTVLLDHDVILCPSCTKNSRGENKIYLSSTYIDIHALA